MQEGRPITDAVKFKIVNKKLFKEKILLLSLAHSHLASL
jgi:hypothetical protein